MTAAGAEDPAGASLGALVVVIDKGGGGLAVLGVRAGALGRGRIVDVLGFGAKGADVGQGFADLDQGRVEGDGVDDEVAGADLDGRRGVGLGRGVIGVEDAGVG